MEDHIQGFPAFVCVYLSDTHKMPRLIHDASVIHPQLRRRHTSRPSPSVLREKRLTSEVMNCHGSLSHCSPPPEIHHMNIRPAVAPVSKPKAAKAELDWTTGLCDCCEDASTCCYGFWCCPCLACTVSERFGENRCLPLCDVCSPAIMAAFGIPLFAPPAGLSVRAAMRNRYGIKGSLCRDIAVSCCCGVCSWCQMHRELKFRHKNPTVINVQNQSVMQQGVVMQPAPGMMISAYPPQTQFGIHY